MAGDQLPEAVYGNPVGGVPSLNSMSVVDP